MQTFKWVLLICSIFIIYEVVKTTIRAYVDKYTVLYKISDFIDEIKIKYVKSVSYVVLLLILVCLMLIQIKFKLQLYDLSNETSTLGTTLGFSLAVLSLYGIYIGFLQYLTDRNEGNFFLGKSKVNYLIDNSLIYNITQSSLFYLSVFSLIMIPIFVQILNPILLMTAKKVDPVKINQITLFLNYGWQTAVVSLLVLYVLLLKMSLKIISVTLLVKKKSDLALQLVIKKKISNDYESEFWDNYKRRPYAADLFTDMLSSDLKNLKSQEIDNYVETAFKGINDKLIFLENTKILKYSKQKSFSTFYTTHLIQKWKFLEKYQNDISYSTWSTLLRTDIYNIKFFEENNSEVLKCPNKSGGFYKKPFLIFCLINYF